MKLSRALRTGRQTDGHAERQAGNKTDVSFRKKDGSKLHMVLQRLRPHPKQSEQYQSICHNSSIGWYDVGSQRAAHHS